MDEVNRYQNSISESLQQENEKLEDLMSKHSLNSMIDQAKDYKDKLARMKRDMMIIREKSKKLRLRAAKILEDKVKEDLESKKQKERLLLLEKHLEPVVNVNQQVQNH